MRSSHAWPPFPGRIRTRRLFDRSAEAIFLHDSQGRLVDCNPEACLPLDGERDEPLEKAIHIGPGVRASFHRNERRRKDGGTFPVEVAIGALDCGDKRLVLASALLRPPVEWASNPPPLPAETPYW